MISADNHDEFVDYFYRVLRNHVAVTGLALAGPGFWVVASLGWKIPEVLFPLLGVLTVAYAGHEISAQRIRALESRVRDLQGQVDPLSDGTPKLEVLFNSDEGTVSALDLDCSYPREVDVGWILREDRKALTTIASNWTYAWTSLELTGEERQEYESARHSFNSNLYLYLDQLSIDLREQQRQLSLVSQMKPIQLVAENLGRVTAEHVQISIRPGTGMTFATTDQIAEATQSRTRIRASDYLLLRNVPGFTEFLNDESLPSSAAPVSTASRSLPWGPDVHRGEIRVEIERLIPGSKVYLPSFTVWFGSDRETRQAHIDVSIHADNLPDSASRRLTIIARRDGYPRLEHQPLQRVRS